MADEAAVSRGKMQPRLLKTGIVVILTLAWGFGCIRAGPVTLGVDYPGSTGLSGGIAAARPAVHLTNPALPQAGLADDPSPAGYHPRPGLALPAPFPLILPLNEQVIRIPMTLNRASGRQSLSLEATLYLPDGTGPFPLVVLSHGTPRDSRLRVSQGRIRYALQSWEFVNLGFAVVIPMRRGYGHSEGEYAEAEGRCDQALFYEAGLESARDLLATVSFMAARPFIDPRRIILAGHSTGGFASLALASQGFPGLVAVINFGGGRGSRKGENCSPFNLIEACQKYGRTSRVPTLWIYCENDTYFPPWLGRQMCQAYGEAGGKARMVLLPPFGGEGHYLFNDWQGAPLWTPIVSRFLSELGF
jgi:dienelactone hydrolase